MVHSYGGYTTNVPLEDLLDGKAWVAYEFDGEDAAPEHGGPARLLVPHLYFWKSAKWVNGMQLMNRTSRASGRRPATTCTETHGSSSVTRATDLAGGDRRRGDPRGDAVGAHPGARRAGLAGAPARPARRRPADRPGRLPRPAQLLDRLGLADEDGKVELTVQRVDDGEVSPYLTDVLEVGEQIELRGPVGGWFVWRPAQPPPVLLVAGGSGMVPLMAMIRARGDGRAKQPFRLIYSVRTPEDACTPRAARRVRDDPGLDVRYVYTRKAPDGWPDPPKTDRRGDPQHARLAARLRARLLRLRPDHVRRGGRPTSWSRWATTRSASARNASEAPHDRTRSWTATRWPATCGRSSRST
jgi:DMSO/TMAO reductase YedYZ molybdopterin-dependent catalytic subunit